MIYFFSELFGELPARHGGCSFTVELAFMLPSRELPTCKSGGKKKGFKRVSRKLVVDFVGNFRPATNSPPNLANEKNHNQKITETDSRHRDATQRRAQKSIEMNSEIQEMLLRDSLFTDTVWGH